MSASQPQMSLYDYICTKLPESIIRDPEVIQLLTRYSTELKNFFSKNPSGKSGLMRSIKETLGQLYTEINEKSGSIINSNTQTTSSYRQVHNELTNNWKRVYVSNRFVIKKTEGILPNIFIEVLIQIILDYYSNYLHSFGYVPSVVSFQKVKYQKKTNFNVSGNEHQYNLKMNRVSGFTLYDYIHGKIPEYPFNQVFLFTVLQKVYEILDFFYHTCGFVHGDLNPANVMIHTSGASGDIHVQIIDFGYSLVNTNYLPDGRKYILSTFVDKPIENLQITTNRNSPNNYNVATNNNLSQLDMKHLMLLVISELLNHDMTNENGKKVLKEKLGLFLRKEFDDFLETRINIIESNGSKGKLKTERNGSKTIMRVNPNMNLVYDIVRLSSFRPNFEINTFIQKMEEFKGVNMNQALRINKTQQQSPGKRGRSLFNNSNNEGKEEENRGLSGLPSFSLGNSNNEGNSSSSLKRRQPLNSITLRRGTKATSVTALASRINFG